MVESNGGAPAYVLINQSPKPRMLVRGFEGDEELIDRLKALVPTFKHVQLLSEVRQAEWDILVTDSPLFDAAGHLGVVYVAPDGDFSGAIEKKPLWSKKILSNSGIIGGELKRVGNLPERISILVHEQLEPVLFARASHVIFKESPELPQSSASGPGLPVFKIKLEPFILTASSDVLAGRYRRSEKSECWLLPADTPDIVPWISAALGEWSTLDPERFPGVPDWSHFPEWMTNVERSLQSELEGLAEEKEDYLARLEAREIFLRKKLGEERERADSYERALLVKQHDDLKNACARALEELGFLVTDADVDAKPDDHLEDLRVEDPDFPSWIALVEVKGYTKGAKTEALTQFVRFNKRYVHRYGVNPDANWYIANQFLGRDPALRQPALHGKQEDVDAFAAGGGLLVDSVILFKLLRRAQNDPELKVSIRRQLRESVGRLSI
jgi:hypothetical protein